MLVLGQAFASHSVSLQLVPCTEPHMFDAVAVTFVPGTSAKLHGDAGELCTILNRAIREDDPNNIAYAVVFARAVNIRLLSNRDQDPWLSKFFKKKQPCVEFW